MIGKYVCLTGLGIIFGVLIAVNHTEALTAPRAGLMGALLFHLGLFMTGLGMFAWLDDEANKWY